MVLRRVSLQKVARTQTTGPAGCLDLEEVEDESSGDWSQLGLSVVDKDGVVAVKTESGVMPLVFVDDVALFPSSYVRYFTCSAVINMSLERV